MIGYSDGMEIEESERAPMGIVAVTEENIDAEHICCALTEKKGETCVASKKAWMRERFADGLIFKKLDVRGKAFVEYMPAEKAWYPIVADGYLHIDCFWIAGQYKGKGHATELLDECIDDAKRLGKHGLTVLSSPKKMPFLSDPKFLRHKGFVLADTAQPYFELVYLPFDDDAPVPRFSESAKGALIDDDGIVIYYTDQCPFAGKYARLAAALAEERGRHVELRRIESLEQAKNAPSAFPSYSLFADRRFVTNEIMSEKKFAAFLDGRS